MGRVRSYRYILDLIDPFGISRATRTNAEIVLLEIDGGWGEAAPVPFYKEDTDTVLASLERIDQLDFADLDLIEDAMQKVAVDWGGIKGARSDQSAKAAFDLALHDRLGRKLGMPLWKLFGKAPVREMVTSFTIGIDTPDVMLRKVDKARNYAILKIKLGRNFEQDLTVMREIRQAVGDKVLRVDANCGWNLEQARHAIPVLADLGVEYVEQPLAKGSLEELRFLRRESPLPIFADEDVMLAADMPQLAGAVDGINIKLMKSGGLVEARRMIAVARTFDMQIMLGCMIESSVAITAAAHLAPFADQLDLDGNLLVSNDPFEGATCDASGQIKLPEEPGLGVRLRERVTLKKTNDR